KYVYCTRSFAAILTSTKSSLEFTDKSLTTAVSLEEAPKTASVVTSKSPLIIRSFRESNTVMCVSPKAWNGFCEQPPVLWSCRPGSCSSARTQPRRVEYLLFWSRKDCLPCAQSNFVCRQ